MRRPSSELPATPKKESVPHLRAVSSRWDREKKANKVEEDELISVQETAEFGEKFNEPMFAADMAREFLGLTQHARDRVGKLRLEEARLQNVIGRAFHTGKIANVPRFTGLFKEMLNAMAGDEQVEIDGKPISKYATEVLDGIEVTMGVVKELESSFVRRRATPESRQLVATNDRLDAGDKIDLVEVEYRAGQNGPSVDRIWLVQVKRAALMQADLEKNHQAHERFVRNMLAEPAYRSVREHKAMELLKGEFQLKDLYPKTAALYEALKNSAQEGLVTDEEILAAVGLIPLPSAVLKAWFMDDRAAPALDALLLAAGAPEVQRAFLLDRVRRWALAHPPTAKELERVLPAPAVVGAANFTSVVVHGGKVEKRLVSLPAGERKALTAA